MDSLKLLVERAASALDQRQYSEAEELLQAAIRQAPAQANLYNMLGFACSQQDAPDKAVECFRRALTINPTYTEAQLNLAITLADMGAYRQALKEYREAKEREGTPPPGIPSYARSRLADSHAELGRVYQDLGLLPQALEEYQKAIQHGRTFADLHQRIALCYIEMNDYDRAEQALCRALDLNPRYVEAMVHLGLVHYKQGKWERAIAMWEQALGLDPRHTLAQIYLRIIRGRVMP